MNNEVLDAIINHLLTEDLNSNIEQLGFQILENIRKGVEVKLPTHDQSHLLIAMLAVNDASQGNDPSSNNVVYQRYYQRTKELLNE
jgi:hypothetical protein